MIDELQKVIDRYLDHEPDEIDAELDELHFYYNSAHASERMDRERIKTVGAVLAECDRRPSNLTVLSEAADIRAMLNSLGDGEVLVVAEDGYSLEIVEVEPGQVVEGAVLLD